MVQSFLRFFVAGLIGFSIDAGILNIGKYVFDLHPIVARIPAFCVAIVVTYFINRHFTFQASDVPHNQSFPRYISANILLQGTNFAIYSGLVLAFSFLHDWPIIALVIASGTVMVASFLTSRFYVFRDKNKDGEASAEISDISDIDDKESPA